MEESSGTRVDSKGSNDLTDNNTVTSGTGIQGTAADFELSNSEWLSITDASQTGLDLSGDFSISTWVKLEQLPSTSGTEFGLVAKNDFTGGSNRAYRFTITSADKLQAYVSQDGGFSNVTHATTDSANFAGGDVGSWVHIVVTFDLSARSYSFYVDGVQVASTNTTAGTTSSINNNSIDFT